MRRISSGMTSFHKRIFPIFWFGFLGFFVVMLGYSKLSQEKGPPAAVFLVPIFMATFGYFLFKKLLFDLVDEVFDAGDFLLVKNQNKEARIQFSNIRNINYSTMTNPQRVTLSLNEPSIFGNEIAFIPPLYLNFNLFAKNPLIEDLINRVDKARRSHPT